MHDLQVRLLARFQAQDGQGMVEYSLILVLVALTTITILTTIGQDVVAVFTSTHGILGGV